MKKLLGSLILSGVLVLPACGSDDVQEVSGDTAPTEEKDVSESNESTIEQEEIVEDAPQEMWVDALIETWSNDFEGLKTTIISVQKSDNATYTDSNGNPATGSAIKIDFHLQNTSSESFDTFPTQGTLVTDSGEQIDGYLGYDADGLDSTIYPGAQKEGSAIWFLEKSKATDIKSVKLVWDSFKSPDQNQYENVADLKLQ